MRWRHGYVIAAASCRHDNARAAAVGWEGGRPAHIRCLKTALDERRPPPSRIFSRSVVPITFTIKWWLLCLNWYIHVKMFTEIRSVFSRDEPNSGKTPRISLCWILQKIPASGSRCAGWFPKFSQFFRHTDTQTHRHTDKRWLLHNPLGGACSYDLRVGPSLYYDVPQACHRTTQELFSCLLEKLWSCDSDWGFSSPRPTLTTPMLDGARLIRCMREYRIFLCHYKNNYVKVDGRRTVDGSMPLPFLTISGKCYMSVTLTSEPATFSLSSCEPSIDQLWSSSLDASTYLNRYKGEKIDSQAARFQTDARAQPCYLMPIVCGGIKYNKHNYCMHIRAFNSKFKLQYLQYLRVHFLIWSQSLWVLCMFSTILFTIS